MTYIERLPVTIQADQKKVLLLQLGLDEQRSVRIVKQIRNMSDDAVLDQWNRTHGLFAHRHRRYDDRLKAFARGVRGHDELKGAQRMLLGACTAMEYTLQAAALFNPSIVPHPDQSGLAEGCLRFILSLRAVGEGHISSIEFMEGMVDQAGQVTLDSSHQWRSPAIASRTEAEEYTATLPEDVPIGEGVLFPSTRSESKGLEDLRLVAFEGDGENTYYGTYTAFDGHVIQSKLLTTKDFRTFSMRPLRGDSVVGKGIALFPRKIRGKYAAIGRQDGETMTMMYSTAVDRWDTAVDIIGPSLPHELVQTGNCGSPIETEDGWLLLTHTVGPMRRYTLSAALLALDNPERVLGILHKPLMEPLESEREGYVPNVLYTCGWMRHRDYILMPYAMSDTKCGFARIDIEALVHQIKMDTNA
jgi:predicted GH43/DUF377 family glycosyl hydrolase